MLMQRQFVFALYGALSSIFSVCVSVTLSLPLFLFLSIDLPFYLFIYPSTNLSLYHIYTLFLFWRIKNTFSLFFSLSHTHTHFLSFTHDVSTLNNIWWWAHFCEEEKKNIHCLNIIVKYRTQIHMHIHNSLFLSV